jgi:hypothetical protein
VSAAKSGALAAVLLFAAACNVTGPKGTPAGDMPRPDPGHNKDFTCTFMHPATSADSLKKLPPLVRRYIQDKVGEIADRGEFFNAGDVVEKPAPFNRFIRGGEIAGRWYLWYEHGGIAYWKQIVILGAGKSGAPRVLAEAHGGGAEGLCSKTDQMVEKVIAPRRAIPAGSLRDPNAASGGGVPR